MSEQAEAHLDPTPDEAPGGVDAVVRDEDDFPSVTPDQPRSAQLEDEEVPDSIEEPEPSDEPTDEVDEPA